MFEINLLEAPTNDQLEVQEINAGGNAKKRLIAMGIHVGDTIVKFSGSSWGPVLIQNISTNSTKIAIGQRLASKIQVSYQNGIGEDS